MKMITTTVKINAETSRMRRSRFQRFRCGSKNIWRSGVMRRENCAAVSKRHRPVVVVGSCDPSWSMALGQERGFAGTLESYGSEFGASIQDKTFSRGTQ